MYILNVVIVIHKESRYRFGINLFPCLWVGEAISCPLYE